MQATELSFLLQSPVTQSMAFLSVLWVMWTRSWFLWQPFKKLEGLMHVSLFFSSSKGGATSWSLSSSFREMCLFCLQSYKFSGVATGCWTLLFSAASRHPSMLFCISVLSQVRQKPFPWAAPEKPGIDACSTVFSPFQGKKLWAGLSLPIKSSVKMREGWHGCNEMTYYLFQCICFWLWACLGYYNFLIDLWSSYRGFLDHVLFLSWIFCRRMKSGASCFAILLMSLEQKVLFHSISWNRKPALL